jgi:hypothetical protein
VARRLRLPLLSALAALVFVLLAMPTATTGAPYCGEPGYYSDCDDIMGYQSELCGGHQYCKVGWVCWTWECVENPGGDVVPQNIQQSGPFFCGCTQIAFRCC